MLQEAHHFVDSISMSKTSLMILTYNYEYIDTD